VGLSPQTPHSEAGTRIEPLVSEPSVSGTYPFVHNLDHLGPFAASLEALALAYDALQGADPLDPGCHALREQPVSAGLAQDLGGLRIGLLGGYFDHNASAPARDAAAAAAKALGASDIVEWPDAGLARAAAFILGASEGGTLHLDTLRTRAADFEPLSVDRFIAGALQPGAWYVMAQRFRRLYRDKVNALFQHWDLLLTPATPVSAPLIGTEWLDINGTQQPCRPAMGLLTQPISFAGCPVGVAPCWPEGTDGMPIGVQLIAAPWREDLVLRAGRVLEQSGVARVKVSNP